MFGEDKEFVGPVPVAVTTVRLVRRLRFNLEDRVFTLFPLS